VANYLSILIMLVGSTCVMADILPPGHKSVSSIARFENLADFPDYIFFTCHHPSREFRGDPEKIKGAFEVRAQRLDPASAETGLIRNPMLGSLYLIAVPKALVEKTGGKVVSDWFDPSTGVLQATIPGGYRSMPESEKRKEFRFVYKAHITGDTSTQQKSLTLEKISEDKLGHPTEDSPSGTPASDSVRWYIIGGCAGAALLLLIGWLTMRRRNGVA
jgi:hypothetical protein